MRAWGNGTDYLAEWSGEGQVEGTTTACIPVISIAVKDPNDPVNPSVNEGDRVEFELTSTIARQNPPLNVNVSVTQQGNFLTGNIPAAIGFGEDSMSEILILETAPDGKAGPGGTITATIDSGTGYKVNPAAMQATVAVKNSEVQLRQPQGEVIPAGLQRAYLVWPAVEGSDANTRYSLEVRHTLGSWKATSSGPTVQRDGSGFYEIDLDAFIPHSTMMATKGVGLADHGYYDFRITASESTGVKLSNTSNSIRVIDNPLLQEGGKAYSTASDTARLEWNREISGTNYEIRHRKTSFYTAFGRGENDHTDPDWAKGGSWPYFGEFFDPETPDHGMDGVETIDGLEEGEIYGFQIKYDIPPATDIDLTNDRTIHVFSAGDAYVWPSDEPPDGRVATLFSFGRHASRTFEYVICHSTFDHPDSPMVDEGPGFGEAPETSPLRYAREAMKCLAVTTVCRWLLI